MQPTSEKNDSLDTASLTDAGLRGSVLTSTANFTMLTTKNRSNNSTSVKKGAAYHSVDKKGTTAMSSTAAAAPMTTRATISQKPCHPPPATAGKANCQGSCILSAGIPDKMPLGLRFLHGSLMVTLVLLHHILSLCLWVNLNLPEGNVVGRLCVGVPRSAGGI